MPREPNVCTCLMPPRASHCCACHVTFGGVRAFDMHQRLVDGKNVCKKPEDVGLVVNRMHGGTVPIWGRPAPEVIPESWSRTRGGPATT